jgi:hypothetical protein
MQEKPMTAPEHPPAVPSDAGPSATGPRDYTDRVEGLAWCALGAVVLAISLGMDRLAEQGVRPYAAPGLLPGLLGIGMLLFGGTVASRRRPIPVSAEEMAYRRFRLQPGRLALAVGLCLVYSLLLLGASLPSLLGGHMPFWLASTVFVTVAILVLQHPDRKAAGRKLDGRAIGFALTIGLGAGVLATVIFENFFLVHLP